MSNSWRVGKCDVVWYVLTVRHYSDRKGMQSQSMLPQDLTLKAIIKDHLSNDYIYQERQELADT